MLARRLIPLTRIVCYGSNVCEARLGFGSNSCASTSLVSEAEYEKRANESLSNLSEYLDTFPEWLPCDNEFDVSYSMGVITANIGHGKGIYVINKQTPNRQIWLSSPLSGPKRYDLVDGKWIYSHDGVSLDSLLNSEFRKLFGSGKIDFSDHI